MSSSRPRRPTLADVARAAGVSLGSASKVMHEPHGVREATRRAVEAAAAALGYVPDGRARALASGRSMMVGVVLPTISNPVYAEFVHVLQRRLAASGYSLAVQAHEYDAAAELAQIRALVGRGIDGIVLVGTSQDPAVEPLLAAAGVPQVRAWGADPGADRAGVAGGVGFCNRAAMRALAEHVIGLGHRRIGCISGDPRGNERAAERLAGLREATGAAGLGEPVVSVQPFSIAGGRAGLAALLDAQPALTAILCTTDLMAAGALAEARGRGLAVPARLSITGFDDIDLAAVTMPPLTTVAVPIAAMGEAAGDALVGRMAGGAPAPSLVLPTRLVVRGSSAPPPPD